MGELTEIHGKERERHSYLCMHAYSAMIWPSKCRPPPQSRDTGIAVDVRLSAQDIELNAYGEAPCTSNMEGPGERPSDTAPRRNWNYRKHPKRVPLYATLAGVIAGHPYHLLRFFRPTRTYISTHNCWADFVTVFQLTLCLYCCGNSWCVLELLAVAMAN